MGGGDLQAPPITIRKTNPLARCAVQILGKGEIHMMIAELSYNEELFFMTLSLLILVFAGWVVWKYG